MKGDLDKVPSDMFQDIVCDGGAPSMDCGLCGRTHFTSGEGTDEPQEEIDKLRALAVQYPDRYVESDCDGLSFGAIEGKQCVYGCQCNRLSRYEDFIWEHRELIVTYIRRRTAKQMESAQRTAALLSDLQP